MRRRRSFLSIACVLASSTLIAQRGPAPDPLVRENVTVKLGPRTFAIPDGNVGLVPNVGIVVGSRATLVIDPGLGRRNGEPAHGEVGPGSIIAANRGIMQGVQARARALKAEGKSIDEVAKTVQAEFQAQHPDWPRANGLAAAARSAYAEAQ
jgi:hypothetical protein